MLKLSVSEGGNYPTGWQTVTVSSATEGEFNGTRYIDLHFKDLPENLKCRIWSAVNKDTGEDFGIGNLFHYADAGITETSDGTVTIDDHVRHLRGKHLNVFFYENDNGYTDAAQRVVPTIRDGFSEGYVDKLKARAEEWARNRTTGTKTTTTTTRSNGVPMENTSHLEDAEVPF